MVCYALSGFLLEHTIMSLIPAQTNSICRDINQLTYAIKRAEKNGRTDRVMILQSKLIFMETMMENMREAVDG